MHITHTSRSHSQVEIHVSQEQHNSVMQLEIDQLKRKFCHAWREWTPYNSDVSFEGEEDVSYRQKSRTPPSKSFPYNEEHHHKRRYKSPACKGLRNDAMSKALNQISKSFFTHKIERAIRPRRFHQPTFTIYNGRTNPMEPVSYFNQRMFVHSKDEALMCKVFPSSLGPVAIRWFNGLKADSIDSFKELTWAFGSRFITCSKVFRPLDSLLSLSMRVGETLKTYLDRY